VILAAAYLLAYDTKSKLSKRCRSWLLKRELRSIRNARILLGGTGVFVLGFGLVYLALAVPVLIMRKTWCEIWTGLVTMPPQRIWFLQGWSLDFVLFAGFGTAFAVSGLYSLLCAKKPLPPPLGG
jgi:hypothetical protein